MDVEKQMSMRLQLAVIHTQTDYTHAVEYNHEFDQYTISEMDDCINDRINGSNGWIVVDLFNNRLDASNYISRMA